VDDRERSICAQSAGAQAATIVAALIQVNADPEAKWSDTFDRWRKHIYEGTFALAGISPDSPPETMPVSGVTSAGPVPQHAPQAPASGNGHFCAHGSREFVQGVSKKNNKPYKMWKCAAGVCEPEFVR